jgi:DDB1- and CUL4-associated factor 11
VFAALQIVLSAGDDHLCKVWDRRLLGNSSSSNSSSSSSSSSSSGSSVNRPVGVLVGHTEGITCVTSAGDGRQCITNSKDQSLKHWVSHICNR